MGVTESGVELVPPPPPFFFSSKYFTQKTSAKGLQVNHHHKTTFLLIIMCPQFCKTTRAREKLKREADHKLVPRYDTPRWRGGRGRLIVVGFKCVPRGKGRTLLSDASSLMRLLGDLKAEEERASNL